MRSSKLIHAAVNWNCRGTSLALLGHENYDTIGTLLWNDRLSVQRPPARPQPGPLFFLTFYFTLSHIFRNLEKHQLLWGKNAKSVKVFLIPLDLWKPTHHFEHLGKETKHQFKKIQKFPLCSLRLYKEQKYKMWNSSKQMSWVGESLKGCCWVFVKCPPGSEDESRWVWGGEETALWSVLLWAEGQLANLSDVQ